MSDTTTMIDPAKKEHDDVVRVICETNLQRYPTYKVLNNLVGETASVAGLFPDIIVQDATGRLLFIIEVAKNGAIAQRMQQWKTVPKIPAFLYFVVPEPDLPNAKSIAQVVSLQVKFGAYRIDPITKQPIVRYE